QWDYQYDVESHLTSAVHADASGAILKSIVYTYDPEWQRVAMTVTTGGTSVTTRYVHANGEIIAELDANNNVIVRYLRGEKGALVGLQDANGSTEIFFDSVGSVRDALTGGVASHADYGAYGQLRSGTGFNFGYRWGGLRYDAETGLYRGSVARHYDPASARWTSQDPFRFRAGDANLYRYAGNKVTSQSDTTGMWWLKDRWDGAVNVVTDAAIGAAQVVQQLFHTVQTTAGELVASAYQIRSSGIDQITWVVDKVKGPLIVLGQYAVAASEQVAKSFVQHLEKFGQSINALVQKVDQFGAAASTVLWALVQDPVGTLTRLGDSIGKGIKDFFNDLQKTLPSKFLSWLVGDAISDLPPLPADLSERSIAGWLLDVFNLNWANIQLIVANKVGDGNVATLTQIYEWMQAHVNGTSDTLFDFAKMLSAQLN
ncbi:MAG: RHS repeat-associated core domain-containing protein, partial [Gemmataceae bacterium]